MRTLILLSVKHFRLVLFFWGCPQHRCRLTLMDVCFSLDRPMDCRDTDHLLELSRIADFL